MEFELCTISKSVILYVFTSQESHTTDWKGDLGHDPEDSEQAKPKVNNRRPAPKQKINFVPLMSREGQSKMAMYLPGRHPCQCLAVKHALINNCVKCGRIVCSQVRQ